MTTLPDAVPVTADNVYTDFETSDFLVMLLRIISSGPGADDLRITACDGADGRRLFAWLQEARRKSDAGDGNYFYTVCGDFSPEYWNHYHYGEIEDILAHPEKNRDFEMRALVSPLITLSPIDPASHPCLRDGNGRAMGNKAFGLFYRAVVARDRRFTLYRAERRMSCHWAATGGRMVIRDFRNGRGKPRNTAHLRTACIEGPAARMRKIARAEFENHAAVAADNSLLFRLVSESLPERLKQLIAAHNRVPRRGDGNLVRLAPARDDFQPVYHFRSLMHKAGNFLLGTAEAIANAISMETDLERSWGIRMDDAT